LGTSERIMIFLILGYWNIVIIKRVDFDDWRHNIIDRYVIPQIDFTASSLVGCLGK